MTTTGFTFVMICRNNVFHMLKQKVAYSVKRESISYPLQVSGSPNLPHFLMFPEGITGIPALRDQGTPFSHPLRASAGAIDGNCSNVQRMIKENARNDLEVVQTTTEETILTAIFQFCIITYS